MLSHLRTALNSVSKILIYSLSAILAFSIIHIAIKKISPEESSLSPSSIGAKIVQSLGGKLRKKDIIEALGPKLKSFPLPVENEKIKLDDDTVLNVEYTLNQELQKTVSKLFTTAKVHYGAFVAMDPGTGKVLSMVSHGMNNENLALRSTFPAASIFKVVTAASAIESGKLKHDSLIPVVGSYHTLYKRNLFKAGGINPNDSPRFARLITFADAFAKSVNSVFGKVGIFGVGEDGILKTALKFGFNNLIPFEFNVNTSVVQPPSSDYEIAEVASGFTRGNTLSPLHGALIASSVANNGQMMEPAIIEKVTDSDGLPIYEQTPNLFSHAIDSQTANELKIMLNRTVTNGTSRGAFRTISKIKENSDFYIGGKTGTLDGTDPPGRYDWFVGFAEKNGKKLSFSTLCIHGEYRGMKATELTRKALENYFNPVLAKNEQRKKRRRR